MTSAIATTVPATQIVNSADEELDNVNRAIAIAYTLRGDLHMRRDLCHLAVADYGQALQQQVSGKYPCEAHPAAYTLRRDALGLLELFIISNSSGPSDDPAMRLQIEPGYLVVGDYNILAIYPLTVEGRQQAIAHADQLAADPSWRHDLDNRYLVEDFDFVPTVYEHRPRSPEGTNDTMPCLVLIHTATLPDQLLSAPN